MIRQLAIENFKAWKKTGAIEMAPITGFFGANSSGKTSLLQFLLMLKQTTESADRRLPLYLGDERSIVDLGTFQEIITMEKLRNGSFAWKGLHWSLSWTALERIVVQDEEGKEVFSGNRLSFEAEIEEGLNAGRIAVRSMQYTLDEQRATFGMQRRKEEEGRYDLFAKSSGDFKFKRAKRGRAWPLPSPVKCYGFPDEVRAYFSNAGFLSDFELAFEHLFDRIFYLGPLSEYPRRQYTWAGSAPVDMGKRGQYVVEAILASKERNDKYRFIRGKKLLNLEELIASWLKELKLIHAFKIRPVSKSKTNKIFQVWVQRAENSVEVLLTDVGFGISQILPVIALCYYVPKGSIVILEQPEIHLHPAVQAGLADVFVHAIKERDIQIILESHSEHLLKRLQLHMAEEKVHPSEVALYFCATEADSGLSGIQRLETDEYGNIKNWPDDFFGNPLEEAMKRIKAERRRKAMSK